MQCRTISAIVIVTSAVLAAAAVDAAASTPGMFRSRNRPSGNAPTRTYRSYSITPGGEAAQQAVVTGDDAAAGWERPARQVGDAPSSAPARPSRPTTSKPSYMRADSKAMGRFGQ